jgi:putative ABC transport system permease protein
VVFATVLGMLTAAPGVIAFSYGQTGSYAPEVPPWLYLVLPLGAAAVALTASVLPTRRALRAGRGAVTSGAR